jgi:hypothetical protein
VGARLDCRTGTQELTTLGALRAEAVQTRTDGVKTYCTGTIADAAGITVEAEGVFITPRWLRN